MIKRFSCSSGHRWQVALGEPGSDVMAAMACPECGSAAETLDGTEPAPHVENHTTPAIPGFEILEEIGQGGMGVVYKARQTRLQRVVALKMISARGRLSVERLSRFRTEAEATARLQHPNIVQIHDVGDWQGTPWFAMEFVEWSSLDKLLAGVPQAAGAAADLTETLARAIHYAHQRGVVHRDLKPANILLHAEAESAIPKISDFGLAKQMDADLEQTRSGAVLGTPSYMAPEQALGRAKETGPPCDVYSLGAILYELLTGRPPFRGPTALETLEQVRHREPVPPTRLQPTTPRDLETICLKCLQKEPRRRYATAEDLAEDLRRFRDGKPIAARPVGAAGRLARWCRRKPAMAGLAAALLLLAAGAFAAVTALWLEADHQRRLAEDHARNEESERVRAEQHAEAEVKERKRAEETAVREQKERERAEKNFKDATLGVYRHSALMLQLLTHPADDSEALQKTLLQSLLAYFQDFVKLHGTDPARRAEAALVYMAISKIAHELGDRAQARKALEQAREGWEYFRVKRPNDHRVWTQLGEIHDKFGMLELEAGQYDAARASCRKALEIWEKLTAQFPANAGYKEALAVTCDRLGDVELKSGQPSASLAHFQRAIATLEPLLKDRKDAYAISDLGQQWQHVGEAHAKLGRAVEARAAFESAIAQQKQARKGNAKATTFRDRLMQHYRSLSAAQRSLGESGAAAAREARKLCPDAPEPLFEAACTLAACELAEEAIAALDLAIEAGFKDRKRMQEEPRLDPVRTRLEFQRLLTQIRP